MNRALKALLATSFLLVCDAHANGLPGQPTPVAPQGLTSLEAGAATSKVRVSIRTFQVSEEESRGRRPRTLTSTSRPSLVYEIEIHMGNRRVPVPPSAFRDLSDVREATLRVGADKSILTLAGGDAAESYVVTIEFDREDVRRRTLASSLAPKRLLEDTRYYTVVVKDE